MAYDGDIKLGVSLSTKDITKATNQLQTELAKIFAANIGKNLDSKFKNLQTQMSKTSSRAMEVSKAIADLEAKRNARPEQEVEINRVKNKVNEQTTELLKEQLDLQQKLAEFEKQGNYTATNEVLKKKYNARLKEISQDLDDNKKYLAELQAEEAKLYNEQDAAKLDNYKQKLNDLNNEMTVQLAKWNELEEQNLPDVDDTEYVNLGTALGAAAIKATELVSNLIKLAGRTIINGIKKLGIAITSLFAKMRQGSERGLKSFSRLALGILGIQGAFNIARKAANAYLQDNEELNRRLQGIWTSLGYFMGPAIEYIINLLATLFGYINSLVRALTGVDMVAKASAAAIKKEGEAAGKASKQLAAFDEMNVLQDNSGNGNNGPSFDFPEFDVGNLSDLGTNIAEKINEVLEGIDWTNIQKTLTDAFAKLVTQLNKFIAKLNWKAVGHTFAEGINTIVDIGTELNKINLASLAYGLASALNQLVQDIDWEQAGETLGKNIINWLNGITVFISNFKWDSLAAKIKEFLMGIDWSGIFKATGQLVGAAASLIFQPIVDYFKTFITKYTKQFGEDGFGLGLSIILGLFDGIWSLMKDIWNWLNENVFKPFIDGFKELFGIHSPSAVMKEQGEYIVEGFKEGISGIWEAIKDFFVNLVLNIISVVADLVIAIGDKFGKIGSIISEKWQSIKSGAKDAWDAVKRTFGPVAEWFGDKFGKAWEIVKKIFSGDSKEFNEIKDGILTTLKNIVNKLIYGLNSIIAIPFNKINRVLNYIKSIEVLGLSPFYNLWSWNPIAVPQIPYLAQGAVIPPNKEFMAILGDQKQGTNVEAPLDTIKQALREVQDENQVQPTPVYLTLDGKVVAKSVIKWEKKLQFNYNG